MLFEIESTGVSEKDYFYRRFKSAQIPTNHLHWNRRGFLEVDQNRDER